jgi:hypothetical protein
MADGLRFRPAAAGQAGPVIGIGIAMLVIGIIFVLVIPWVGFVVGLVGLALAVIWVAGFGRSAARGETTPRRRP